ncbi:MAG: oligosaccharide flippase family protein [Clostridia bacterium]|nr:oligosaccharide flippase family protein [Clostridia bacterium]
MRSQRGAGFILSYLSIFISSIVGILFTPYMISSLGQIEYGLYQLLYAAIGYIALLDFGLGSTLTRFILKYRTEGDKEKVNIVITMCVKIYSLFGLVAFLIVWIVSLNLETLFQESITADNIEYARQLFLIMGVTTSISLVSHALTGVQTAHEKYIVTKGIYIARQLFRVVVMIVLLQFDIGAMAVVISDFLVTVFIVVFDIVYCKYALKVPIINGKWDNHLLKALFSFSFFVFLQIIITQVNVGIDRLVLGRYSCLEYVALYGVVSQLYSLFNSLGNVICSITLPKISQVVFADASVEETTDCCVKYSRLQFHILSPLIGGFIILGKQFASLWAPQYDARSIYIVALLTITPQILESVEGTIFNVMKAKNLQATRSLILTGVAVVHIVLSISLTQVFPLYGTAIGSCISFIIGNNILSNIYYHKKVGINMFRYFKNLFKGVLPALIISLAIGIVINFIPVGDWLGFIIKGCLYVGIYGICVLLIGLDTYEKSLVKGILKKIRR